MSEHEIEEALDIKIINFWTEESMGIKLLHAIVSNDVLNAEEIVIPYSINNQEVSDEDFIEDFRKKLIEKMVEVSIENRTELKINDSPLVLKKMLADMHPIDKSNIESRIIKDYIDKQDINPNDIAKILDSSESYNCTNEDEIKANIDDTCKLYDIDECGLVDCIKDIFRKLAIEFIIKFNEHKKEEKLAHAKNLIESKVEKSKKRLTESMNKLKEGYSNNSKYVGDWYGDGQIDYSKIIDKYGEGDVYLVKMYCGTGRILDVYLVKATGIQEAIDKVFTWSWENEGHNDIVFERSYLEDEAHEYFESDPDMFGKNYAESEEDFIDRYLEDYVSDDNYELFARSDNFFVDKVPDEVLEEQDSDRIKESVEVKDLNLVEFDDIPEYAINYLVNDDKTGLDEEDIKEIDNFMAENNLERICDVGDDRYFVSRPAFGKATSCVSATFVSNEPKELSEEEKKFAEIFEESKKLQESWLGKSWVVCVEHKGRLIGLDEKGTNKGSRKAYETKEAAEKAKAKFEANPKFEGRKFVVSNNEDEIE